MSHSTLLSNILRILTCNKYTRELILFECKHSLICFLMLCDQYEYEEPEHDEMCTCTGHLQNSPYFIWCVMMLNFKQHKVTTVGDINLIHWHNRAGSKLTLTAESRTPPGVNCSLVGKTDSTIVCQGVTQCRLETSMKTQVTDTALVKAGGVHFGMAVSEWSINLQHFPTSLRVSEVGQTLR